MTIREVLSPVAVLVAVALLLTAAIGFVVVPAEAILPTHWGLSGSPDQFAPRNTALMMPVGIAALVGGIFMLMARYGAAAQVERGRHLLRSLLPALLGLFLVIEIGLVMIGTGAEVDMVRMIVLGLGVLLLVMGNMLPKTQPNGVAGIRLPWMMDNPAAWQAGHRVAGGACIIAGLLLMTLAIATGSSPVLFLGVVAAVLVPMLAGGVTGWRVSRRA